MDKLFSLFNFKKNKVLKHHWSVSFWVLLLCVFFYQKALCTDIYLDPTDSWSLMYQGPYNRNLHEQLKKPENENRLITDFEKLAVAADVFVGSQQPLPKSEHRQTRFHGFYILDAYTSLRLFDSIDINLNITLFNPSASDGYKFSNQILTGLNVHLHKEILELASYPLIFNLLLMDLDSITIGNGLLIEQIPLEGLAASIDWKNISLTGLFAGRVFWPNDDFFSFSLGLFQGHINFLASLWKFSEVDEDDDWDFTGYFIPSKETDFNSAYSVYVGFSTKFNLLGPFGFAAEYLFKPVDNSLARAFMLRADYKDRFFSKIKVHMGYQLRYYQHKFGPVSQLLEPTTSPALPKRENMYFTNSFEYMLASVFFDQLSHTFMTEFRLDLTSKFQIFYELEYLIRLLSATQNFAVVYFDNNKRAPGVWHDIFYHAGLSYRLIKNAPHRVSLFISNKWVYSDSLSVKPMPLRYATDPLWGFELELFL